MSGHGGRRQPEYFDDRCAREAFAHLVVGTHGYPGWVVVGKFGLALRARARLGEPAPRTELLREPSWSVDILPEDQGYEAIVGAARRFDEQQRRRAARVLRRREAELEAEAEALLRERLAAPSERAHLLRERG